jgi:hypothetical protein
VTLPRCVRCRLPADPCTPEGLCDDCLPPRRPLPSTVRVSRADPVPVLLRRLRGEEWVRFPPPLRVRESDPSPT